MKTLAISGSIIYASVVDHIFLEGLFNGPMILAAIVVVIAVLNYNFDATPIEISDSRNQVNLKPKEKDAIHTEDSEEKRLT